MSIYGVRMKFRIEQSYDGPDTSAIWALTEFFYWDKGVIDIMKKNESILGDAYRSIDWELYYEKLRGTPFYKWAREEGGILDFGGPYHIRTNQFFSCIADTYVTLSDYLKENSEFNHVLHDIHIETAQKMIDFIMERSKE